MPRGEWAAELDALAEELHQAPDAATVARIGVARALTFLPEADHVSLSVPHQRRHFDVWAATSPAAIAAVGSQHDVGEGPCLVDRAAPPATLRSGDVRADVRWPRWAMSAEATELGSVLMVPLGMQQHAPAALAWWSHATDVFGPDAVELAQLVAGQFRRALDASRALEGAQNALRSRHEIGVAQGILIERYDLDLDRSFDLLRRVSSSSNIRVTALAQQLIEHGTLPE